jgi:DUF4097 and DUF4098 domain-containing protein YvlB
MPLLVGAITIGLAQPADAQRRRDRDERVARLDTTLTLARGGIVELQGPDGTMIINGWDRNEVHIRASAEDGDLRVDATSSRVALRSIGMGHGDVRYDVTVPFGSRLLLNGRSTDLSVRGTRGEVEAHTQNGDVDIAEATAVDVNSLNGDVELRGVERVRLNLVSGDVRIDGVSGTVDAATVSGDVEMRNATSRAVSINSTSGDLAFHGSIDPSGRYEFSTHSGSVVMRLPADVSAAVSLQTYSGAIESDFPIRLEPGATMGGHPRTFDFRLGNGGARITARSFSGSVLLQRAGTSTPQED